MKEQKIKNCDQENTQIFVTLGVFDKKKVENTPKFCTLGFKRTTTKTNKKKKTTKTKKRKETNKQSNKQLKTEIYFPTLL